MKFNSIAEKAAYWQEYAAGDYELIQRILRAGPSHIADANAIQELHAKDALYARKLMGIIP